MDSSNRTKEQQGKLFADYVKADVKITGCTPAAAAENIRSFHNVSDEDWLRYVMPHLPVEWLEQGAGVDQEAEVDHNPSELAEQAISQLRGIIYMGGK